MVRDAVRKCSSCEAELGAADAYCWWCGAPVTPQTRGGPAAGAAAETATAGPPGAGSGTASELGAQVSRLQAQLRQLQAQVDQAEVLVKQLRALVNEMEGQINQIRAQAEYEWQPARPEPSEAVGADPSREAPVVFGPRSGSLPHNAGNDQLKGFEAGVWLRDFIAEATFYNPYDFREKRWTYGFGFRHTGPNNQYRLILLPSSGRGRWELQLVRGGPRPPQFEEIASGEVPPLKLEPGAANTVVLVADGPSGELYVNGRHIATLNLSGKVEAGDVWVGIGFYRDTEITGRVTRFENFVVRRLQ